MESIPKSNLFLLNYEVNVYLSTLEEVVGKNGLKATLNLASMSHLIDNYPPKNTEKEFDFADFSTIVMALEEIYGAKAGRMLCARAGKMYFNTLINIFSERAGFTKPEFTSLPGVEKLRIGLPTLANASNAANDQRIVVEEREDDFLFTYNACPSCWGRLGEDSSICALQNGYLQGALLYFLNGEDFSLVEEKCCAVGDPFCQFVINKPAEG